MWNYVLFALTAALPAVVSVLLLWLDRTPRFRGMRDLPKQVLIGVCFGLVAVCATEFGLTIDGESINARNAAPLCAALLFGGPAGIIAGVTGGAERWLAVLWGASAYSQLADSLSTVLAGLIGAALRKVLFEGKRPGWGYAFGIGAGVEILHMLLLFYTNTAHMHAAFVLIEAYAYPTVCVTALSVALAAYFVSLPQRKKHAGDKTRRLSERFQSWLLILVIVAFLVTSVLSWRLQTNISKNDNTNILRVNIEDTRQDILDASDENLLEITRRIAAEVKRDVGNARLTFLRGKYDVAEINLIDRWGVIYASTEPGFIHYNMNGGAQSAEFLCLLSGEQSEFVQSYQAVSSDSSIFRKYAGVALSGGGFIQVGYDAGRFQRDIDDKVINVTKNRHIGENGFILIASEDWVIVSDRQGGSGQHLSFTGLDPERLTYGELFSADVYGQRCYCMAQFTEGYYIIGVLPQEEALFSREISIYVLNAMDIVVFMLLFALVYVLIKKLVVSNMRRINDSLSEITGGNLDVVVDARGSQEFVSLSKDINSTVATLKRYIADAAARIDQELENAKEIQVSALPNVFPPYPDRPGFDIYASMDAAKEVGGDFYDFYLLGDKLAFLIADVSGKGIPAAMFMMKAKTQLKSLTEAGYPLEKIFEQANAKLWENNDAEMFVTAWMGILDLDTGLLEFVNAGHNYPLLRRKGEGYEYLKKRSGLFLAADEELTYKKHTLQLMEGDELFLYTDGVTEATNSDGALYGDRRLKELLNSAAHDNMTELCRKVKGDVLLFAGEVPQYDDITMLAIRFEGGANVEGDHP